MKSFDEYNKLRGGYYTPEKISEFITNWAIRSPHDCVLEPSCGDGSFLKYITYRYKDFGATDTQIRNNIIGIELDHVEAEKSSHYGTSIACKDFFTYYQENIENKFQFDVVLGNPPFIRYQNFTEEYRKIAFSLMSNYGFQPNRLTNIWLPFLILSCKALKPSGRIGMVIPAELFYVEYAAESRQFLSKFFDKLTIITFKQLVFDDIQQEVVLLLGERGCNKHGIRVTELEDIEKLNKNFNMISDNTELKELDHSRDKWIKYFLSNKELNLLKQLNNDIRITNATDLFESNVGIISGENNFFVLNHDMVKKLNLHHSVIPVISRSEYLKGIQFTDEDYNNLIKSNKKVYLFTPGDKEFSSLSENEKSYILWGEEKGYNKNYKCRIRPKWYHVQQSWCGDAFFIRHIYLYPRIVLNEKKALVTDTLHKIRFLNGVNGKQVTAAFLNTYTFALIETIGKSYGGGVLNLEPGGMRKMRIPMKMAEKLDLEKIDYWQRQGEINKILDYTDTVLLHDGLGLNESEIQSLHSIWYKLRDRRMQRKPKKK